MFEKRFLIPWRSHNASISSGSTLRFSRCPCTIQPEPWKTSCARDRGTRRPLRGSPFEYLFYLDLLGRAEASPISEALAELRSQATSLRVLGTYPRFMGN